eukprot:snap_masked-scaffold_17-processed-gene-3.21-mRNA-1 protein AED:1.00 eAED:1.00 QI:0/-1/0/0/-1/1/1/0/87
MEMLSFSRLEGVKTSIMYPRISAPTFSCGDFQTTSTRRSPGSCCAERKGILVGRPLGAMLMAVDEKPNELRDVLYEARTLAVTFLPG